MDLLNEILNSYNIQGDYSKLNDDSSSIDLSKAIPLETKNDKVNC